MDRQKADVIFDFIVRDMSKGGASAEVPKTGEGGAK